MDFLTTVPEGIDKMSSSCLNDAANEMRAGHRYLGININDFSTKIVPWVNIMLVWKKDESFKADLTCGVTDCELKRYLLRLILKDLRKLEFTPLEIKFHNGDRRYFVQKEPRWAINDDGSINGSYFSQFGSGEKVLSFI